MSKSLFKKLKLQIMKKIFLSILTVLVVISGISFTIKNTPSAKGVMKQLNKNFGFIPSGNVSLDNKDLSVQAFYMSKTVVTNGEYQAFLNDLKEKGENEKYATARVDSSGWNKVPHNNFQVLAQEYFQNVAYAAYPVVNVSKEGAELYCEWLTEKTNKLLPEGEQLKFRLPLKAEWLRAAEGTNPDKMYTWDGPYLRNSVGQRLANYVTVLESSISRNDEGRLAIMNIPSKTDSTSKDTDITAPAASYFPNEFGLYNLNGNVSEILAQSDEVIGGSWHDAGHDIRNRSTRKYQGASAMVGFRVVTTIVK